MTQFAQTILAKDARDLVEEARLEGAVRILAWRGKLESEAIAISGIHNLATFSTICNCCGRRIVDFC
jgi:hypothetical protein